jgi:hypothetical protein
MIVFKAHHSFCDGVSIMCMCLALSEEYNRDYFVKSNDAKWYETLFIKFFSVFQIPLILQKSLFMKKDRNFITFNK